jgi:hypothetical protein
MVGASATHNIIFRLALSMCPIASLWEDPINKTDSKIFFYFLVRRMPPRRSTRTPVYKVESILDKHVEGRTVQYLVTPTPHSSPPKGPVSYENMK